MVAYSSSLLSHFDADPNHSQVLHGRVNEGSVSRASQVLPGDHTTMERQTVSRWYTISGVRFFQNVSPNSNACICTILTASSVSRILDTVIPLAWYRTTSCGPDMKSASSCFTSTMPPSSTFARGQVQQHETNRARPKHTCYGRLYYDRPVRWALTPLPQGFRPGVVQW